MHLLKRLDNTGEICSAAIFIILIGIFSIPIAFLSFRCIFSHNISFSEQGLKKKESIEEVMFCKILVLELSCKVGIFVAMVGPILIVEKLFSSLEISS